MHQTITTIAKTCRKCGEAKPPSEFYKNPEGKNGLSSRCKGCICAQARAYYTTHKAERDAFSREYYLANKERLNASGRAWSRANKKERAAYSREYQLVNKEKIAAISRVYRQANPEVFARAKHKRNAHKAGNEEFTVTAKELRRIRDSACTHCGTAGPSHVDHVIPVSKGGRQSIGNLMPLCQPCNTSKRASFYSVWRYR